MARPANLGQRISRLSVENHWSKRSKNIGSMPRDRCCGWGLEVPGGGRHGVGADDVGGVLRPLPAARGRDVGGDHAGGRAPAWGAPELVCAAHFKSGAGLPFASRGGEPAVGDRADELRVWREKVLLVHHLRGLDPDSLARRIYQEQRERAWPGLARETTDICRQLGIPDCNTADILATRDKEYRKMITESCKQYDKRKMEKEMEGMEKCEKILNNGRLWQKK